MGASTWSLIFALSVTGWMRYAEASRLAPFEYVALLWPIRADVFIFRQNLSTSFVLAAPLILAGAAVAVVDKVTECEIHRSSSDGGAAPTEQDYRSYQR